MKYKLTGAVSLMISFVMIILVCYFVLEPEDHSARYHQHLEEPIPEKCTSHSDEEFCTHLPLIEIFTPDGIEIPGRAIVNENGSIIALEKTPDGMDEITARIEITDESGVNHHTDDAPALVSKAIVHARGNSSRTFDKLGYSIDLIKEDGTDNDVVFMGMDAHSEWALHGPYLDKTLLRTYMWYNIAGELMEYSPNVRFCELVINGEYMGVYVATEKITAGENGARLNLEKRAKDNSFYGYMIKLDSPSETPYKNINNFSTYTWMAEKTISIVYPKGKNLTPEFAEEIARDFSVFEKNLYSYDYDNETHGYDTYIDVDSFVNYFLINELTVNYDAGGRSTFMYRDISNIYKMCVWDFNACCGNYIRDVSEKTFFLPERTWFSKLVTDEDFTDRVIERYRELRETYFSDEYLMNYIDETIAFLGPAIDRNFEKWGYTFDKSFHMLYPRERDLHSYDEAIAQYKNFILTRALWMDENIETLKSFSAESAVKQYTEISN